MKKQSLVEFLSSLESPLTEEKEPETSEYYDSMYGDKNEEDAIEPCSYPHCPNCDRDLFVTHETEAGRYYCNDCHHHFQSDFTPK